MKRTLGAILIALLMHAGHAQTPPAPGNLIAQSPAELQTRVLLSWNHVVAMPGFYRIYRSTGDSTAFQWIGVNQANKFEDRTVTAGVLYYYYVTAVVFADSTLRESPRSNLAAVRAYALPGGPRGIVRGRVVDQINGLPIPKVRIRFFTASMNVGRLVETMTDMTGAYTAPLDSGSYLIRAEEVALTVSVPPHLPEWYENAATPDLAQPVRLAIGDTLTVDFALTPSTPQPYAYISGTVTDDNGAPLSGVAVAFVRPIQEMNAYGALTGSTPGTGIEAKVIPGIGFTRGVVWIGYTNPQGKYYAQVLSGRPYVAMAAKDGYTAELYDNVTDPTQATILAVHGDTTGIDFSLAPVEGGTGSMQGIIRDEDGGEVPARIILFPRPKGDGERPAVFVHTDSSGNYELNDLPPDTYQVLAVPYSDYGSAYYTAGGTGTTSWVDADTVVVNGAPVNVNITLPRLAGTGLTRIAGRVLAADRTALGGVRVIARLADGRIGGYGLTDPGGHYDIDALPAGTVTLLVDRFRFDLVQSPVVVPQNAYMIDNVDFILTGSFPTGFGEQPAVPDATRLYTNYPNPFNPVTTIRFDLARSADITLTVHDLLGREVARLAQGLHGAGSYTVAFDASGLSSGVYYYVLRPQGMGTQTGRMVLVK